MSIVAQETAVATKTRMNSDYVPGIVTVLQGDELEALGFRSSGTRWRWCRGSSRRGAGRQPVHRRARHPVPVQLGQHQDPARRRAFDEQSSGINGSISSCRSSRWIASR
jgi:hypothetical protein